MSGVKKSLFLKSGATAPSAISSNLKLHWDTTQTSGSGSTGVLNALAGSATGDMIVSSDVDKSDASSKDSAGNQGWKFQDGLGTDHLGRAGNTQLLASQALETILGSSSSNFTVEIWAKINSKQDGGSVFFNSFGRSSYSAYSTTESFVVGLYGASNTGLHSQHNSNQANTYNPIGGALTYGSFAQYVITAGGSSGSLVIKNYLNGTADGTLSVNGTNFISAGDFLIGGRYGYGSTSWNGVFRICRIYSTALSQTEITNNFNAEKAKFGL